MKRELREPGKKAKKLAMQMHCDFGLEVECRYVYSWDAQDPKFCNFDHSFVKGARARAQAVDP